MKKKKHKLKYSKINGKNFKANTGSEGEKIDLRMDVSKNKIHEQGSNKKRDFTMLEEFEKQQEPFAIVAVATANDLQKESVANNDVLMPQGQSLSITSGGTANGQQPRSSDKRDSMIAQGQIILPPLPDESGTQNDNQKKSAEEKNQASTQAGAVSVTTEVESNAQNGKASASSSPKGKARKRASLEERLALIEKQREILDRKAASLKKEVRKERDGQLIAWGIMTELIYKSRDSKARNALHETAKMYLKERELKRALSGFNRLDAEIAEKESKSE